MTHHVPTLKMPLFSVVYRLVLQSIRNVKKSNLYTFLLGIRNVINHAPTLAEVLFAMPLDTIKYLYKYHFDSSRVTR